MVETVGIEPTIFGCGPNVFPLALRPQMGWLTGIEPAISWFTARRPSRWAISQSRTWCPRQESNPHTPEVEAPGSRPLSYTGKIIEQPGTPKCSHAGRLRQSRATSRLPSTRPKLRGTTPTPGAPTVLPCGDCRQTLRKYGGLYGGLKGTRTLDGSGDNRVP